MATVKVYFRVDSHAFDLNFYARSFYDAEFYNNRNYVFGKRTY